MEFEGAQIRLGGIADVACLPEERRKGYAGALLRAALVEMREGGVPLSALTTPHVPLYRRYGWEIATRSLEVRFPVKQGRLRAGPEPRGHVERIDADQWQRLHALYTQAMRGRNGGLGRWEGRWREAVFKLFGSEALDVAVWVDDSGQDRGYATYTETGWQNNSRGDLRVAEFIATDGAAARGLFAYLLQHDNSRTAIFWPDTNPLVLDLLEDPGIATLQMRHNLLLRIVDLPAALAARPCYATAGAVTLAVVDRDCPWNAGTWRITPAAGRLAAEATKDAPDLTLDIGALAPLYNGLVTPTAAALAGQVMVHRPEALALADALLPVRHRPWSVEYF